jgi:predicted dehydrogenase
MVPGDDLLYSNSADQTTFLQSAYRRKGYLLMLETLKQPSGAASVAPVRVGFVGAGGMARHHIRQMLQQQDTTCISLLCEPSTEAFNATAAVFTAAGVPVPLRIPDFETLLRDYRDQLDAVFIITPHAYHHAQAVASMEAGLDVFLEKPMVLSAVEAQSLINVKEKTGRLLVVAFQGSLSPQVRTAYKLLHSGELGKILNINAMTWQNWGALTAGTWRQQPELSGGGFMFDTGAHMLNTVSDLVGEDFVEVAAWLDNRDRPVEILGVVMARLKSGAILTLNGCGDTIPSCNSDIWFFCTEGILRTGQWGEHLELQRRGETTLTSLQVPASHGAWEQFLAVRSGTLLNPCPPNVGLRMARLYDAIRLSSSRNGMPVHLDS